jgi:uncharacterized delta-60 repeat protein
MARAIILGLAVVLTTPFAVWAAAGDPDPAFGPGGYSYSNVGTTVTALVLQPDGKLVSAGVSSAKFAVNRSNSDGVMIDTTFGGGAGFVTTSIGDGATGLDELALQPDGKIVAAGGASVEGNSDIALVRYNTDGTLDTSFGVSGGTTGPTLPGDQIATGLVLQGDGKLVVAAGSAGSDFIFVRYDADGSIDSGFGSGGVATVAVGSDATVRSLVLQPDGMLVAAGWIGGDITDPAAVLVRIDSNGTLDPLFGSGGIAVAPAGTNATDLLVEPSGKLVAAAGVGPSGTGFLFPDSLAAIRWNADGSLDSSFGSGGVAKVTPTGLPALANAIVREPDGGFLVAGDAVVGSMGVTNIALARFEADGNLDPSYGSGGLVLDPTFSFFDTPFPRGNALIRQPDGKAVVGGTGVALDGPPFTTVFPMAILARYLGVFACGNGIVEPGESCDDGNLLADDCCSPSCERPSCRAAGKSFVLITGDGTGPKDKLIWKWLKGDATSVTELGDPTSTTNYTLCLYAGADPPRTVAIPAQSTKWTPIGTSGFRYVDPTASSDGVSKAMLKSGAAGKAKALVKAKGSTLPDGILPIAGLPLVVQLINSDTGACFVTTIDTADVTKNTSSQFKAKSP